MDISEAAVKASKDTFLFNDVGVDIVRSDILSGFSYRPIIDLLLVNPPYVQTSPEEMDDAIECSKESNHSLSAAWAGGHGGVFSMTLYILDDLLHVSRKQQVHMHTYERMHIHV